MSKKKQNKWNDPFYAYSRCMKMDTRKWRKWRWMGFPKKNPFM